MGWRDRRPEPRNPNAVLLKQIELLTARVKKLEQTGPTSLQLIDFEDYEDDLANVDIGETHINWPGVHRVARRYDPAVYFHDEEWRALGSNAAVYEIKVFEDDKANIAKSRAFVWEIPEDLDGAYVMKAGAFVTTTGGDTAVSISNDIGGGAVLQSNITVPAGSRSSKFGTTPQAIGDPGYPVEWGDQLAINTVTAGGMGLGVWVLVVGAGVGGVALQGFKGDPGGITGWTGAWTGNAPTATGAWVTATGYTTGQIVQSGGIYYVATANHTSGGSTQPGVGGSWSTVWSTVTYSTGDAVSNNGSSYVAIVDHMATVDSEPGVGADWEDFWMLLSERQQFTALTIFDDNSGIALDIGQKAVIEIPFDCNIVEYTLLSDLGNLVLDLRKDTYANYPPTAGDSIVGSNPPTLAMQNKVTNSVLTGWSTALAPDDVLTVYLTSASFVTWFSLNLKLQRV